MYQSWGKLLFMHWSVDPEILRPLIPAQLSIDTFAGPCSLDMGYTAAAANPGARIQACASRTPDTIA